MLKDLQKYPVITLSNIIYFLICLVLLIIYIWILALHCYAKNSLITL